MARVRRRRGSLPPILVVLITMAAIVATALVAYFIYTTTKSAVSQAVLEVTDAYVTGSTITFTVRNIGSVDLTNVGFPGNPQGTCSQGTITLSGCSILAGSLMRGSSAVIRCTASAAPRDGDMCTLALQATNQQTGQTTGLTLSFRVVTP